MKKITHLLLALCVSVTMYGSQEEGRLPARQVIAQLQAQQENFHAVNFFQAPAQQSIAGTGTYMRYTLDEPAMQNAFKANYQSIRLALPMPGGDSVLVLLTQQKILTDDFMLSVTTTNGEEFTTYKPGLYYQGIVEG